MQLTVDWSYRLVNLHSSLSYLSGHTYWDNAMKSCNCKLPLTKAWWHSKIIYYKLGAIKLCRHLFVVQCSEQ